MLPEEVVEGQHVLLLGELHVVGDVLQDLGHEHQPALHVRRDGPAHDAHLLGGHCEQTWTLEIIT